MGARFDGNEHSIGRKGMPAFSQGVFRVPKECPLVLITCMPGGAFLKKKNTRDDGGGGGVGAAEVGPELLSPAPRGRIQSATRRGQGSAVCS